MNFIAFLAGLLLERLLAGQLGLREPRWLAAYVRGSVELTSRAGTGAAAVAVVCALLPGLAISVATSVATTAVHDVATLVHGVSGRGHGLLQLLVAAVVLFFSLGPRDLKQEVREYRAALARDDRVAAERVAAEILEHDAGQRQGPQLASVGEAVFVQANNRLFGVLFWFAVLGPFGALGFRLTDLMRREAILCAGRPGAAASAAATSRICQRLHGVLAFVPARLVALSYGVAGSFEESFTGWRGYLAAESDHFFDANDRLLLHAGRGALGGRWEASDEEGERAGAAVALTEAAFYVWLAGFALLTLVAWIA